MCLCMVQFDQLPFPLGFAMFFVPGGLFPTPEHAEEDNSHPLAPDRPHNRFFVHLAF